MDKLFTFLDNFYNKKFDYPKDTEDETELLINTWYMFLKEYSYVEVSTATKKICLENEWPPTPGEIILQIERIKLNDSDKLTGAEAWSQLQKAISYYGRYNQKEMMESLPERVAKAARVTGLEAIYMNNDTYMMNRYIETYKQIKEHDFERQMLPNSVQQDMKKIKRPEVKKLAEELK